MSGKPVLGPALILFSALLIASSLNAQPRTAAKGGSLAERYGTRSGYVAAVSAAAANAVAQGYLLQADADSLIAQATAAAASLPLPPLVHPRLRC